MAMFSKNLLKSLSNFSNNPSLYILKRHHIFKSGAAVPAADEKKYSNSEHRLLVRRFRWSGIDEIQYFSDSSRENLSPITERLARVSEAFHIGIATPYFFALSPQNFSPLKNSNFPSFENFMVVGSCHGLVCLENSREGNLIWNPSTNEVKSLPPSKLCPPPSPYHCRFPVSVEYSSSETLTQASGLGYDSTSNDYKLVRWVDTCYEDVDGVNIDTTTHAELYSFRSDSWKTVRCPAGGVASHTKSAYVNGHYYWSSISGNGIKSFDFATENFCYVSLPHTVKSLGDSYTWDLFEFRGSLGAVVYPRPEKKKNENKSFELWVWNDGSWTREFGVYVWGADKPLGFWENGRFLFLAGGSRIERLLLVYDITTKDLKKVDVYCHPYLFELIPYVETMVPLKGTSP